MKNIKKRLTLVCCLLISSYFFGQDQNDTGSTIQTLTPSKLIATNQWDIKWFNNLYTETKSTFESGTIPRQTFFTSTLEAYTGVSESKRINVGLILEVKSNVISNRNAFDVFKFDGDFNTARSGFTSFAPSVKVVPFTSISNFSIQSSFFIPLVDNEVEQGVFLDQKGFTWQNKFFYDYSFPRNTFQLFSEINTEFNFGKTSDSFANNSLNVTPGLYLSYFPTSNFTVLTLIQHSQRLDLGNNFKQNYTAIGGGVKYQLSKELNIESLYTNFIRGNNTGLGETFNIGLRVVF